MPQPHLVYFADPMCSWCWGFSPVITAITERFGAALPIRLVLGGLRPGTESPMSAGDLAEVRHHWEHVHEASGQPFDYRFFERERFVYDTEPASRAVVVLRRQGMEVGLAALRRIQQAFYAENRDVTDTATLAGIATEFDLTPEAFRAEFDAEDAQRETWADFAVAQKSGVRGFPTLIAGTGEDGRYGLVTNGFQPAERIVPALERWFETANPRAVAAEPPRGETPA